MASHSLQPYRGCTFGKALYGVGCYVQHNRWLTRSADPFVPQEDRFGITRQVLEAMRTSRPDS